MAHIKSHKDQRIIQVLHETTHVNATRCFCSRKLSRSSFRGLCCCGATMPPASLLPSPKARPLPPHQPLRFCNNILFTEQKFTGGAVHGSPESLEAKTIP